MVEQFNVLFKKLPKENNILLWNRSIGAIILFLHLGFLSILKHTHICIYRQMECCVSSKQSTVHHSGDLRALRRRFLRGVWLFAIR